MRRKIQLILSSSLLIASFFIVYQQRFNLWYFTGDLEDVAMMFIAVALSGTGIFSFIHNENELDKEMLMEKKK